MGVQGLRVFCLAHACVCVQLLDTLLNGAYLHDLLTYDPQGKHIVGSR